MSYQNSNHIEEVCRLAGLHPLLAILYVKVQLVTISVTGYV